MSDFTLQIWMSYRSHFFFLGEVENIRKFWDGWDYCWWFMSKNGDTVPIFSICWACCGDPWHRPYKIALWYPLVICSIAIEGMAQSKYCSVFPLFRFPIKRMLDLSSSLCTWTFPRGVNPIKSIANVILQLFSIWFSIVMLVYQRLNPIIKKTKT